MASGFFDKIKEQFGIVSDDEAAPSSSLQGLTPEQIRAADLEIMSSTRGKRVEVMQDQAPLDSADFLPASETGDTVDGEGNVNFAALYQKVGVRPAKFTAEQALDMIHDCEPTDTARRQTIKMITVFGKNVGATPDEIVVDAVSKQDALHAFNTERGNDLVDFQTKVNDKRESLKAQLAELEAMESQAKSQYDAVRTACLAEHERLETVRDFFRQEVPIAPAGGSLPARA